MNIFGFWTLCPRALRPLNDEPNDAAVVLESRLGRGSPRVRNPQLNTFYVIGEARGDFVAVTEGLKAGDVVVSTGVFKLRNGMPVVINNDLAPKPQLNPRPIDS